MYLERGLHISIEEWNGGSKGSKSARFGLNPSLTTFLYAHGSFSHCQCFIFLTYEMEIVIVPRKYVAVGIHQSVFVEG